MKGGSELRFPDKVEVSEMFSVRTLTPIVIILALLSIVLGWQVYSTRQSSSGEATRLREELQSANGEVTRLRAELEQQRQAGIRANQTYLDVSRGRVWHIRAGSSLVIGEIVLAVAPQVNGIALQMGAAFRPGLLGSPRTVRVLTTAPNWGAEDKVLAVAGGVVRVKYQFPLAVTEATISLAP